MIHKLFELGAIILFVRIICKKLLIDGRFFVLCYPIMKLGNEAYNLAGGASKCIQTR